jgi:hypothetical protein
MIRVHSKAHGTIKGHSTGRSIRNYQGYAVLVEVHETIKDTHHWAQTISSVRKSFGNLNK